MTLPIEVRLYDKSGKKLLHSEFVPGDKMEDVAFVRWDDCWFLFEGGGQCAKGHAVEEFFLVDDSVYDDQSYSFEMNKKFIQL